MIYNRSLHRPRLFIRYHFQMRLPFRRKRLGGEITGEQIRDSHFVQKSLNALAQVIPHRID